MEENMTDIPVDIDSDLEKTKEYIKRILYIENEIKGLKEDIKLVKQEAKEDGILTKEINKAISKIKAKIKEEGNPTEITLVESFMKIIEDDADLYHSVASLLEA